MAPALFTNRSYSFGLLVWIAFGIQGLIFSFSYNLPLFGDAIASVSKPAWAIYESGLSQPWNYPDSDPGHPTLYPFLIAIFWKIFGLKLWVPHLLQSLFAAGTAVILALQIHRIAPRAALPGLLLLFISPLYVSQAVGVSLQTPLTFFFMASWMAIANQRGKWLYFTLPALLLTHLQGILLLPVLGALQLFYYRDDNPLFYRRWIPYAFAGLLLSLWFWGHYLQFGWITASPNYERGRPGLSGFVINLIRSGWRMVDFGYLILWLPLLLLLYRKQAFPLKREIMLFAIIFTLPLAAMFVYPPAHRYFLPLLYWLPFVFVIGLALFSKIQRGVMLILAIVLLLSGHFWVYPGKCAGDANMAYLGWFTVEKEIKEALPNAEIYTYAPLANEAKFTRLTNESAPFKSLYNQALAEIPYVLRSNMNCEFTASQLDTLQHWPCRVWQKGGIYGRVYANPVHTSPPGFSLMSEPGSERRMKEIKEMLGI